MRRISARDSRWRRWSPKDASSGAVPFQEAKWPRLAKRLMLPTSPSGRAAPDGPMPCNCRRVPARGLDEFGELFVVVAVTRRRMASRSDCSVCGDVHPHTRTLK